MNMFGIDIANEVAIAFSGQLNTVTLTRENRGTYDETEDTYSGGAADSVFMSEGIVENYSNKMISDGLVTVKDRKITILAQPLTTVPMEGDKISIEGQIFKVIGIAKRDPAEATYTIQGRL
jgi:hypothetical protein